MASAPDTKRSLYEQDFDAWLHEQVALARDGKAAALDLDQIAEELEEVGRRERRALESHLTRLLMHLLKWRYQPTRRSGSWHLTIRESRRQLARILRDSPSLKAYFHAVFEPCYADARGDASAETGLSPDTFPTTCPFTPDEARDPAFLPD